MVGVGVEWFVVGLLVAATFGTAVLSAVAGFGGGVLLVPVFVAAFGPREAVAILTVTQVASNGSRVVFNRTQVDRHLVGLFSVGAVPAAVLGAVLLTSSPVSLLTKVMGVFLLAMVVWRRVRASVVVVDDHAFVAVGVASGFGSALVGSVGPMVAPFFLARGLVRGAYIGTEAASALVMHLTKVVVFGALAVLTWHAALIGFVLAAPAMAGAWVGKVLLDRLPVDIFVVLVEVGLVAAGLLLIVR